MERIHTDKICVHLRNLWAIFIAHCAPQGMDTDVKMRDADDADLN